MFQVMKTWVDGLENVDETMQNLTKVRNIWYATLLVLIVRYHTGERSRGKEQA